MLSEPTVDAPAASPPTAALLAVSTSGLVIHSSVKAFLEGNGGPAVLQPSLNPAQGDSLSLAPGPARPSPSPWSDDS